MTSDSNSSHHLLQDMLNMNNQCCNWYTTKNTWT